jgi:L,D-peptidoglycan transpeptidase YkuD (ErfK/YbiS/YcfS/YnhG family)
MDRPAAPLDGLTDGCIAVTNAEMDEIWRAVPDGTPIEIQP